MHDEITGPVPSVGTIDDFVDELSRLRTKAGSPSYAEIAMRIARHREVAGLPSERARVARSTVYDVFRPGRRRLDVGLVREILVALDLDAVAVRAWVEIAQAAVPATAPAGTSPTDPAPAPSAPASADPAAAPRGRRSLVTLLLVCVAVNLFGRFLVVALDLPLHLDMTGTAISAIALGPWWGALVGVVTNVSGVWFSGVGSIPFALVNVTGALVWGYGVHRYAMGRSLPAFFSLNVLAAVACSVVATPIILLYSGLPAHASADVADQVVHIVHFVVVGVFLANLLISFFDKSVSGFIALVVVEARKPAPAVLALGPDAVRPEPAD